jgi:FkbM family methyltransferase
MPLKAAVTGAEFNVDKAVRARFFPGQQSGVLVEVGAAHPSYLSLSALYRGLGWRVVAIEPNPEFCELHRAQGYEILQYACGDHDEDNVDFTVVDSHGAEYYGGHVSYESFSSLGIKDSYAGLIGSGPHQNLSISAIKVNLRRLDTLLEEYAVERVDLVAVDVEGWELEVLDGFDMARFKPRVLIIENLFADRRYRTYMRNRGYALWRHLEPNDIYVVPSEIRWHDRLARSADPVRARGRRLGSSVATRIDRWPLVSRTWSGVRELLPIRRRARFSSNRR